MNLTLDKMVSTLIFTQEPRFDFCDDVVYVDPLTETLCNLEEKFGADENVTLLNLALGDIGDVSKDHVL